MNFKDHLWYFYVEMMQCGVHSPLSPPPPPSPQPMWSRFNCPYHTFGKVQFARPNHNTWAESVVGFPPRVYLRVVNTLNFNFNMKTVNRESVSGSDDPELQ